MSASFWVTTTDQSNLLTFAGTLPFNGTQTAADLLVDATQTYQTYMGAGAAMTETSADLINGLPQSAREALLEALFGRSGIALNLVRVPLGASDFISYLPFYSYEDVQGTFNFTRDLKDVFPLLRLALLKNPQLKLTGTPWSAPAWMKTSLSLNGGSLSRQYVGAYASYLTKVVQMFERNGIPLDSITPANEPEYSTTTYPSMYMAALQQIQVVQAIDIAFTAAKLKTQVAVYDHNWSDTTYPSQVLQGLIGISRVQGAAFHCYGGQPSQMLTLVAQGFRVHNSECSGTKSAILANTFADTLMWQSINLIVQSMRSGSETIMLWNLALDQTGGPQFGNCGTNCNGVVTISNSNFTRNADYYVLGHVSKFVQPGAVRIGSTSQGSNGLQDVVWLNPDGSRTAIIVNPTGSPAPISITDNGKSLDVTLPANSVITATWPSAP